MCPQFYICLASLVFRSRLTSQPAILSRGASHALAYATCPIAYSKARWQLGIPPNAFHLGFGRQGSPKPQVESSDVTMHLVSQYKISHNATIRIINFHYIRCKHRSDLINTKLFSKLHLHRQLHQRTFVKLWTWTKVIFCHCCHPGSRHMCTEVVV